MSVTRNVNSRETIMIEKIQHVTLTLSRFLYITERESRAKLLALDWKNVSLSEDSFVCSVVDHG